MVEKENQSINQDTMKETTQGEAAKKKISLSVFIVPAIIVVILIAFFAVVYYGKVIKPKEDVDKEAGFNVDEYIQLDKYTGFDYEITQDDFDECVKEETDSYEEVKRAAKETDQIDFNYTGYVDGEKDTNITQKEAELIIGQEEINAYKAFSDAIAGHKTGEKVEVTLDGADVTELSADGSDYTGTEVTFTLKINSVSKLVSDEVTDKWVKKYYFDDYGLETADDFYQWCKDYILEEAKTEVWQMVVDSANMSGYPQEVYDDIVTEFTQDANYYADYFGISTESYLEDFYGYTDETLEEEYLNEVKSELVMWYIIKKQLLESTDEEVEEKYEELYEEMGYDTAEDMKVDYTTTEITKAVLLDKAQDYVFENSNIKESFTVPSK